MNRRSGSALLIFAMLAAGCTSRPNVMEPPSPSSSTSTSTSGLQITVRNSGTGAGAVSVNPPGPYKAGDVVVLTPVPGAASVFTAWTAPCPTSIPPLPTCTLTLTANTTVTAQFDLD